LELNFNEFLEMAHLIPRRNGQLNPIFIKGKYIRGIDFKFETYPDQTLKRRLLGWDTKFYGLLDDGRYLVFDGHELDTSDHPPSDAIELPKDWYDYALVELLDGKIKEPKN